MRFEAINKWGDGPKEIRFVDARKKKKTWRWERETSGYTNSKSLLGLERALLEIHTARLVSYGSASKTKHTRYNLNLKTIRRKPFLLLRSVEWRLHKTARSSRTSLAIRSWGNWNWARCPYKHARGRHRVILISIPPSESTKSNHQSWLLSAGVYIFLTDRLFIYFFLLFIIEMLKHSQ